MICKYKRVISIAFLIIVISNFTCLKVNAAINDTNRNFKRITIDDGLSQGSANVIYQDTKGYMWIGTADGLNRYNGNRFDIYKYSSKNKNTISGNTIYDITEDYEGNLWVGTKTGLNKIDLDTNEIKRYLPEEEGCNISDFVIRDILVTRSGDVLVGTNNGLNIYDKKNDNFVRLFNSTTDEDSLSSEQIYALEEDGNGDCWVGTRKGLNKVDKNTGKISKYFANENDANSISGDFIRCLTYDREGYLWIGTNYLGLNKLDIKTGKIEKFMPTEENKMPGALIRDVLIDGSGNKWIGTDFGFTRLNEKDNTFSTYKSSKYNSGSIIDDNIADIFEDKTGAIWIGTPSGISIFNPENLFNYYKADPFNENSLSSDSITGIYEDGDGLLWIGTTMDGLNIFDRTNNKITKVDRAEDYPGEFYISDNLVREITGIDNEIWIATQNGLDKYDKVTKERTRYDIEDGLSSTDIKTLHIDNDGVLWIGTGDGICSFDRKETIIDYSPKFKEAGIENLSFTDIYEDSDGILWMGAGVENGLIRFDKNNNTIDTYLDFDDYENTKTYSYILNINSNDDDNLWLGTDRGLIKFEKETQVFTKYTEENGLANNFIYGILFDDENHIWVSTNYGISKFDIENDKFINFSSTDGIQGNEFNQYSYFKSKSGEMFFGGTNGLTSFMPQNIKEKAFIPAVQIEDVNNKYHDKIVDGEINLSYKETQIHFDFFMPDYAYSNKIKYEYMLDGLDKNWTVAESERSAHYTNLKPGKYTFKVIAQNSSGQWSKPTSVKVNISNPPWKTSFAYFIYFIVAVLILYIIWNRVKLLDNLVKQRTTELNNKLKENEELYSRILGQEIYKNNYFINLSHELRTPLNIISSAQNLISSFYENDIEIPKDKMLYYMKSINRNCGRLLNLIENIINTSKIEAGSYKLNLKEKDIVYLVEEVALSMKDFIEDKGVELIVEPFMEEKIIDCDEVEVERVIINLISNAIKFTEEGGKIEVYIWDLGNDVKISVKDSGKGIDSKYHKSIFDRFSQAYSDTSEEHGGSGLGLTLSKYLVELHGGEIWVESEVGKGSEFIIILPIKH